MSKNIRSQVEWTLFILYSVSGIINKLWVKDDLLANVSVTLEIAWFLTLCYGFKSRYRWLVIAGYIWRILLIASLLFIWWNYFFNCQN